MKDPAPTPTPPIDPAGFRVSWERLGAPRRMLLAVSGGSDSMALMRLAASLHAGDLATIAVATVDHRLRAGSSREAAFVAAAARDLGLPHAILDWAGEKPASGIQAAARAARYGLLVAHACALHADAILTAHTADDQAETVLMRLARGSGPRGLAGMRAETSIAAGPSPPVRLLRPLLLARRGALRAFLGAAGASFVDDPGNDDPAFERVRARRLLASAECDGELTIDALCEAAAGCRRAAERLERQEQDRFADLGGRFDALGAVNLAARDLSPDDAPLIARVIRAVSGGDHEPRDADAALAIEQAMARGLSTLGGAEMRKMGERLLVGREPAALLGRSGIAPIGGLKIGPGGRVLWDGRFIIANKLGCDAVILPIGSRAAAFAASADETAMLAAAPALWVEGDIAAIAGESPDFQPLAEERFLRRVNRFPKITAL